MESKDLKQKLKEFIKKPVGMFAVIIVGTLILFVVVIKLLNSSNSQSHDVAKEMENQKATAITPNVRYTTQETLNTLTGETDNLGKAVSEVQKGFNELKNSQGSTQDAIKQKVEKELDDLQKENAVFKKQLQQTLQKRSKDISQQLKDQQEKNSKYDGYRVGHGIGQDNMVWVKDMSHKNTFASTQSKQGGSDQIQNPSVLHPGASYSSSSKKNQKIPKYTIPANTILTGVTSTQPLVGVIPTNGTVINPETVLFVVGDKNLAANNWRLPAALKGIQGRATCQGVFNFQGSAVRCDIISLTFIFNDGKIATENTDSRDSFGQLTTLYGNPYIPGTYHGNATYGAVGTGLFSALQGAGNAFAASQVETQTQYASVITSFKNATSYALGQGLGSTGQAMKQWWNTIMKSMTNFVYADNWNPETHQMLQLNAVISKEVDIDYDTLGRKVSYESNNTYFNNSLD